MERYKVLEAFIGERKVGTLALYKGRLVAFEYNEGWLREGFSISPFSLPLQKKVFIPKPDPFDGLFGAFADSLPDGWGRLLVDRMLNREHVDPAGHRGRFRYGCADIPACASVENGASANRL